MWKAAIEDAIMKTKANIARFDDRFPHVSENGVYHLNDNTEWTNGFWAGLLWLCYEYSGDDMFRDAGRRATESFRSRLDNHVVMDHHDIGFLYILSAKAQWLLLQDEAAKQLTIASADALMKRWREKSQLIQAWGAEGDPNNGGRIIIDCLLNLPLLYWAYEQTGEQRYYDAALTHAEKSRRYLVRGDDSSYHTFYFDQETGEPLRGGTHQGYSDGSTWTRGQAWGVYGFGLTYRYTQKSDYLDTAVRMAIFFLKHLPEDDVSYWDFDASIKPDTKRDSSAAAITACGILELLEHLPADHPKRTYLQEGVDRMMRSLVANYSTMNEPDAQGLLNRGSYNVRKGVSPDDPVIWGDYYYLEALMRLERGHRGYW